MSRKKYISEIPSLLNEWDWASNSKLGYFPDQICSKSNIITYWLCSNGHSYPARPNNKTRRGKSRCNLCYITQNSLANKRPNLAMEWHPVKNGNITPNDVSFGKNIEAWWLCPECGHEWEALINNRSRGRGCPECRKGTQTSTPEQLIYTYILRYFPDAVNRYIISKAEIDVFIPSLALGIEYDGERYHNSKDKIKKDINKNVIIANNKIKLIRIREELCYPMDASNCEIFTIRRTCDYSTLLPLIETILNKITGSVVTICHSEFIETVNIIKSIIYKVPYERSLAYYVEQQEKSGSPLKLIWDKEENDKIKLYPENLTIGSGSEAYWVCKSNKMHKSKRAINRIVNGEGCAKCMGRDKTRDEWIAEARTIHGDKYDYSQVDYINTENDVVIICRVHGEFGQDPSNHLSGNGCPWCAGQGGYHILDTLAVAYPELAKEWDYEHIGNKGLTPNDVLITDSVNEYWWKCNNGKPHSYSAKIGYRIKRESGCSVCHGKQVAWDTCLEYLRPDLVDEWHESNILKPSEVTLGSEKEVVWKCQNPTHPTYKMPVCQRVNAIYGCQICSGRKRTHESFSKQIEDLYPNIQIRSNYVRSDKRIECVCTICGQAWSPIANNLLARGCAKCKNRIEEL